MIKFQTFSFNNKVFRVIPHLNKHLLFVEILNTQNSNLFLYVLDLNHSKVEFVLEYQEKQLLDFAAHNFLVFKLFPSKVLPIVKGIKVYDWVLKDYILDEPEAQNLEYYHDNFTYKIFDKKQTVSFPSHNTNQFLFPKVTDIEQIFEYQNVKIIITPKSIEILHQNVQIFHNAFQDTQFINSFIIHSFLIIQTKPNEITVYKLDF